MKHDDSFSMNLPTIFPCLLTSIILNQHHEVVHPEEAQSKKAVPLTFDYRLFVERHVPRIMVTKHQDQSDVGNSSPLYKSTINDVLLELMEVLKSLQETIRASTIRKNNMDELIRILTKEKEAEEEEEIDGEEEGKNVSEEEGRSSEDQVILESQI